MGRVGRKEGVRRKEDERWRENGGARRGRPLPGAEAPWPLGIELEELTGSSTL